MGGDIIRPHLLTTAIGHARVAVEGINTTLAGQSLEKRPRVDAHHWNLLHDLKEHGKEPTAYDGTQVRGTSEAAFAIHNFEDRAEKEIVKHTSLYLGHFGFTPRHKRDHTPVQAEAVIGNFEERLKAFAETQAVDEAKRCMSCGLCFECNNCLMYCPQGAVALAPKGERGLGRYVVTDYDRCIGCHICADVCPTGYIQMGMGD